MENNFNNYEKFQTADTVSYRRGSFIRHQSKTVAYYADEEFKEHPEYDRYLIGTKGTIYDKLLDRKLPQARSGKNGNDYTHVYIKEAHKFTSTHRLVLETFDPNPNSNNLFVNHIDGIRCHNEWSSNPDKNNLEWVTPKENIQHAARIGRMRCGENHPKAIFTNEEVHQICQMMSEGKSSAQIAEQLNIEFTPQFSKNLCDIRNGRSYSAISSQYENLHQYCGNHIKLNPEIVQNICELISQGKSAPEIAQILDIPYEDGTKFRSLIQSLKSGQSHREITQNYTFPYRRGAKGFQ